ncbi:MAG: aminomethyl-transferring glycine dehydrogenase subunit GcvPB [Thermoleophilia bacterium]
MSANGFASTGGGAGVSGSDSTTVNRYLREGFHAARWQEPVIMEQGSPGERGVLPPPLEAGIRAVVGDPAALIPAELARAKPPALPEVAQPQVLRHYLRLSQMTMGTDVNIDLGLGTCTMKYSPKVNEFLARSPKMADIHPWQPPETVQGILEIAHRFGRMCCEISGLDAVSFQPASGAQGIFTNASIIRAYHEANGEGAQRDEIVTTIFSHPADSATPAVLGYKLIVLYPDETGYPNLEQLQAALSERTAGLLITNPEDTGLYNPHIQEFTDAVHAVGGLCSYDQANLNGIMGIARAKEAGFDLCHFNLHKTFSSPHGSMGPGCGAVMVRDDLRRFLPRPLVEWDGERYFLDDDLPHSIGKVRSFLGNLQVVLRAYAWVMSLGAEGLRRVSETAVINNRYLMKRLRDEVPGLSLPYQPDAGRLDEARFSWGRLHDETGIGTEDVERRILDYGVNNYFSSHEPFVVPEPFTPEPTESYSRADLDEYTEIIRRVAEEAYADPHVVATAPHKSSAPRMDESPLHEIDKVVTTWRVWKRLGLQVPGASADA